MAVRPLRTPGAKRWRAPAKVNLTLHVLGRDAEGWHELDSLVAFAGCADWLDFAPGESLSLSVDGLAAGALGPPQDNLVLKAARALAERVDGLRLGRFHLHKVLPIAAGLGGGSSDAAAALRALAHENGLSLADPRLRAAAAATGSDVAVCLEPSMRMMGGRGERVGAALGSPPLFAVLANPGVAVPTPAIFAALGLPKCAPTVWRASPRPAPGASLAMFRAGLLQGRNDLQAPAIREVTEIGVALQALAAQRGAWLTRMSGSGATCFALFGARLEASAAARDLRQARPSWWVKATTLR